MADDLEKTSEEPRNRYEAIKAYLLSLLEKEEDPEVQQKYEKSLAELINFGGDYEDEDSVKRKSEGGLLDEGGEVDEESGNDVPIGGTKEGVRDDIPAMLSEGEFVFPEDVTRYHGLEKLMTLRQEAKMGLKKMEAMGQMGNSEEATMPDDLPFNMDDLILVVGEEESKEKDDKPIKAQAGTFVPSQQNLANQGIMGTQQSIYQQPNTVQPAAPLTVPASSLVPANTAPVGGYTAPTVLAAPATGYSPLYATEPVPTVATKVDEPEFVPDVSSEYKPVKYINPTTGDTMMINEYQGNPVSAVPAGYIRHSDFLAQGGTDTETTDTTTDTGVETAQVATGGRSTDDEKRENEKLFDTLKTNAERKRVEKYNTLLAEGSSTDILDEYKKSKTGQAFSALLGPLSIPANLLLNKEQKKIEEAYLAAAAREKIDPETAKKNLKEIGILSSAKDTISGFGTGIKDTFFTEGGLDNYNKTYDAQFSLEDFSNARGGINFDPVQGYIKGSANNNLTSIQQQQFDMAIRNGNMSTAKHYEMIARGNDARNQFAKEHAEDIRAAQGGDPEARKRLEQALGSGKKYNNLTLGMSSLDSIIEYGGGVATAINDGRATAGGTFKKAEVVNKTAGIAGEKGPIETASNTVPTPSDSDDDPNQISFTPPTVKEASNVVSNVIDDITSSSSNKTSTSTAAANAAAAATRRSNDNDRNSIFNKPAKKTTRSTSSANRQAATSRKSTPKKSVGTFRRTESGYSGGFKKGGLMEKDK